MRRCLGCAMCENNWGAYLEAILLENELDSIHAALESLFVDVDGL